MEESSPPPAPRSWTPASASAPPSAPVKIPSNLPTRLGVWNIVIASLSLMLGACFGFYALALALQGDMGPAFQASMQQAQQQAQQEIQQRIDKIDEQIAKAESDEERQELQSQRDAAANAPPPPVPDLSGLFSAISGRGVKIFGFTEVFTGFAVNMLLMWCGVGLLNQRAWAPKWTKWTAVLKLGRLWILYLLLTLWLLPGWISEIGAAMGKLIQSSAPPGASMTPQQAQQMQTIVTTVYLVMGIAMGVAMMLFGSIYPAILLMLVRKPEVQEACHRTRAATPPKPV